MSGSDGMDCNELVELVTDYLDDALTDGQRQAFEAHLAECDGCENYVNQMRKTVHLTGSLSVDDIEPDDPQQRFRLDVARRLSVFLRGVNERGPQLERDDLDDAAQLLGRRPAGWRECDAALESLVASAGPDRDADFIRFFHRRVSRWQSLLAVGMHGRRYSVQPLR